MSGSAANPKLARTEPVPRLREPVVVSAPAAPGSRVSRRRAARRAVLWGIAAVAVANLGFALALETVLPQLRDPETGYRHVRVRELQRRHPDRPLVLVLGTSRTQNAIDPAAMGFPDAPGSPLVFNFGQAGAHPPHMRANLRRLREDGVRPAAVLVELFPGALGAPGPFDHVFAESPGRLSAGDVRQLEEYVAAPAALRRGWVSSRLNPWSAHRQVVLSHLDPSWQPWQQRPAPVWRETTKFGARPYRFLDISEETRRAGLERARALYAASLRAARVDETADRALRDLIADCRAAGVPAACFFTPESPTFRSWYATHWRAALAAYARALSGELNCPVFDAPADYAEEDFADGHHMLRPAAARFSRWLADTHLKPWFATVR